MVAAEDARKAARTQRCRHGGSKLAAGSANGRRAAPLAGGGRKQGSLNRFQAERGKPPLQWRGERARGVGAAGVGSAQSPRCSDNLDCPSLHGYTRFGVLRRPGLEHGNIACCPMAQ